MQEVLPFQALAGLGVGGILAGVIFVFYRLDRRESEERIADLGQNFREIVERNTQAFTLLTSVLSRGPRDDRSE